MLIQPPKRTPANYPRPFVQFSSKPVFIVSSTHRPGIQTDNNGDSLNTETSNHGVHTDTTSYGVHTENTSNGVHIHIENSSAGPEIHTVKNSYSVHTENSSGGSENTSNDVHTEVDIALYREDVIIKQLHNKKTRKNTNKIE